MNWFNNAPIRVKLISIMTLTAMLALFLETSAVVINEYYSKKHDTEKQLKLIGDIISWNASASLTFKDLQTAQEMLKGLHTQPSLVSAQLYDNSGNVFAVYESARFDGASISANELMSRITTRSDIKHSQSIFEFIPEEIADWFNGLLSITPEMLNSPFYSANISYENNMLHLYRPILLDGELQGILHLVDDQSGLKTLLNRFYLIISLIVVITGFAILVISTKLQQVFLAPLLALMQAMRLVTHEKNFSRRISQIGADEFGEMAGVYNAMLTEIQQRDQQLALHRERLELQVIARTHELSEKNENLKIAVQEAVNAKELAEAASKAKSQFLATMSHEIRTPMNGVLGMTELLINTELSHRQKHLAETAYRSAESLLGIINNILDFSKIEASKFQLNMNDFDLRALLEETSEILACQAHQKKLELVLNMPVDFAGVVHGDCERLRQVLINLLGNAIKFTHAGEVQLKISLVEPEHDQYMHILFEVMDTGPGIPFEQQEAIFESFTQVDGSITRRFGGTGLGLTISRQLVALMGGVLRVDSTPGQGARFYFSLLLERSQHPVLLKANIKALQGVRILVVDDNYTNREILHDQLSYWGVIPTCVESADDALKNLQLTYQQNNRYGLILLDWHMPHMDGLTLAKLIQNDSRYRGTPMVMLSSDNLEIEAEKEFIYGIRFFLTKPVIQQKLLNCLLEVLGQMTLPVQKAVQTVEKKSISVQKGRILLAEDQPVNQQVGQFMLQDMGYQVTIANNGMEAVDISAKNSYDLILMDCHMPEMDGFEATKTIRTREQSETSNVRIPIIALTADVQKGITEQCLEAGMDGYLSKPFSKQVLQNVLDKWLADPNAATASVNESRNNEQPVTPISSTAKVKLNPAVLDNLRQIRTDNGETLLTHAIKLFLQSAEEALPELRRALDNQDSQALRKAAHGYKSVCANLGADVLAETYAGIESLAKLGKLQEIPALLASVELYLPQVIKLLHETVDEAPATNIAVSDIQQMQAELKGIRILLVDDDSQFRQITRAVLEASGFIVSEAVSGSKALEIIAGEIPDLVLLDAIMDGVDGFETCRLMREMDTIKDIPIIMATGLGDLASINRAFEVGATDFVIKPLNYPIVVHRLWFIVRANQNTAELRTSKIQLSAAQRIARLGYWTWNSAKNHFLISENLAAFCGTSLDNFDQTLESFIELIYLEDREKVKSVILASIENNLSDSSCEYRLQPENDQSIYVFQEIEAITENNHCIITGTVQDISNKKQAELQMHRLAYFDNLTGLASRAYYHERIADFIRLASRHEEQFAFLFIDLDGFKDINDSFGHDVGDNFLKAIAERIKLVVRDIDFAARLGGDEFCIILDKISEQERAAEVADRCLSKLNQPLQINQHQIKPRASIGIAFFPRDGANEVELMKAADAAMYAAKQAGKQRYVFYSQEMASQAISRLETEQMLHDAFEYNQFVLHYQPQISMQTGRMVAMEALIRWHHPEKGLLAPMEFIPLLEQMGLMTQLGNWALEHACKQILEWRKSGLPYLRVAVNITPAHFQDPALFSFIKTLLADTGIPSEFLELEVTESAMQTQGSLEVFRRLRESGLKIALDDFGTGYSCLASLNQLPLDYLKVDRIFVADVLTNANTALLLGTIIGLANALDYTVVAEGVETKEQALVMHGLGCHIVQGYLFSRPVAGDQIPDLLNQDFTLVQNQS